MGRRKNGTTRKPDATRILVLVIVFVILALVYRYYLNGDAVNEQPVPQQTEVTKDEGPASAPTTEKKTEKKKKKSTTKKEASKPAAKSSVNAPKPVADNQIVKHQFFSLSYNNDHEQADWVFYLLTQSMINGASGRSDDFRPDPDVVLLSATKQDYNNSGYDRGHLCPSADVRITDEGQSETFYMSNMSPQKPAFNRGIWKKLEEQTRRWVGKHDSVYIATGPVLKKGLKKIGRETKVSVPEYYYKILYSPADGGHVMAFLLPNDGCSGHTFSDYMVSVDEVEAVTGIDFFPLIDNEELIEKSVGSADWWN